MKTLASLALAALFLLSLAICPGGDAAFAQGGTPSQTPIPITTCLQLQAMNDDLTASYVLMNDIDCSETVNWNGGAGFVPIGTGAPAFTGTFDGQHHAIAGLYINRPSTWGTGLFGYTGRAAAIANVDLVDANITGFYCVGGLVGENLASITHSHTSGRVSGSEHYVGGLVGGNNGPITDSSAAGTVGGHQIVGGLIGWNYHRITQSHSTASVSGGQSIGGLVGRMDGGTITVSYATGSASGSAYVGGLVGENNQFGTITNCYASGRVSGNYGAGGLVGYHGYAGAIAYSYSTGSVDPGYLFVGGLVGLNNQGNSTGSFWDTGTSGQASSAGGTGKTTAEMMQQGTFVGWDFVDVWRVDEGIGYPYLLWERPTAPDTTPPVIAVPGSVVAEATGGAGAVVAYTVTATDDVDGSVTPICAPASGLTFTIGATTVSCTATDTHGNTTTATFSVTVQDTTPPVFSVPDSVVAEASSVSGAIVSYTATATDEVDGNVPPSCTPASGSIFAIGATIVNCTATDTHGNTGSAAFTVKVEDTTAPTIMSVVPSVKMLWPASHQMVPVQIVASVTDRVTPVPACRISDVRSNEPINGLGDGDTAPDWSVSGELTVNLRAERAGGGTGRIYTVTVTCQDNAGNIATKATTVGVPKSQGK